ncbi:hypothetical protein CERSUDRAFT_71508 [Gelatoporia subvermispora B]|uniref:Uncharacterized protein n=1 Tax=Ceriporiopsis subvermispora (strain B) TaxID=914234 RepID=M2RLB1_CERS8|nr:hypothetical protein CERSUDRAFT_71508 [Gelatoporia subvermispora B]
MTDFLCLAATLATIYPFTYSPLGDPGVKEVVIWAFVIGVILILLLAGLFLYIRYPVRLFGHRPAAVDHEATLGQLLGTRRQMTRWRRLFGTASANNIQRDGVRLAGLPPTRVANTGNIDASLPDIPAPPYSPTATSLSTDFGPPSDTLHPSPYETDADLSSNPASTGSG